MFARAIGKENPAEVVTRTKKPRTKMRRLGSKLWSRHDARVAEQKPQTSEQAEQARNLVEGTGSQRGSNASRNGPANDNTVNATKKRINAMGINKLESAFGIKMPAATGALTPAIMNVKLHAARQEAKEKVDELVKLRELVRNHSQLPGNWIRTQAYDNNLKKYENMKLLPGMARLVQHRSLTRDWLPKDWEDYGFAHNLLNGVNKADRARHVEELIKFQKQLWKRVGERVKKVPRNRSKWTNEHHKAFENYNKMVHLPFAVKKPLRAITGREWEPPPMRSGMAPVNAAAAAAVATAANLVPNVVATRANATRANVAPPAAGRDWNFMGGAQRAGRALWGMFPTMPQGTRAPSEFVRTGSNNGAANNGAANNGAVNTINNNNAAALSTANNIAGRVSGTPTTTRTPAFNTPPFTGAGPGSGNARQFHGQWWAPANDRKHATTVDALTQIRTQTYTAIRRSLFKNAGANNSANAILIRADATEGCMRGNTLVINGRQIDLLKRQGRGNTWLARFNNIPMYVRRVPLQNEDELVRLHDNTRLARTGLPFFPLTYGAARCGKRGGRGYYVVLTEAFHSTLRRWVREPRQPSEFVSALAQVLIALAAIHGRGLVHGALTPDNIVFTQFPRAGGWWDFKVGSTHMDVKQSKALFALNNMGKSAVWNSGPSSAPPCEVRDVLRMFATAKVSTDVRRRVVALYKLAAGEPMDAPTFLQNAEVKTLLRGISSVGISIGARVANSRPGLVEVVPATYVPYDGPVACNRAKQGRGGGFGMPDLQSPRDVLRDLREAFDVRRMFE